MTPLTNPEPNALQRQRILIRQAQPVRIHLNANTDQSGYVGRDARQISELVLITKDASQQSRVPLIEGAAD